jgi:tape measure domain-containing protein
MGNILEFFVKMKDLMSGGLTKLVSNSQSSFAKIQSYIDGTIKKNRQLADSFEGVGKKAGGSGGGGGIAMLGKFAARAGAAAAIIGIAAKAISFGSDSIQKAMEFGSTKISFEVLTGDKNKGQALANDLNKLQQDTILGPEVFKNAQTMLGFGIATDKVLPTLRTLGDVSLGNAQKMESLTLAYSQVQAAGRLMGQDLLQFINAGFNPLQQISKDTGLSIGVLKKKMEEGAISADMVAMAFTRATGEGGLFNGMMSRLAETPAGKMAQLEGQFESFKVKLGEALMPLAEVGLKAMEKLLAISNQVIPYIVRGVNFIRSGLASLSDPSSQWGSILAMAGQILGRVWNILQGILARSWAIFSAFVAWIAKSNLLKDIFFVIGGIINTVLTLVEKTIDAISWLYDHTLKPILEAIEWAYNKVGGLLGFGDSEITLKAEDAKGGSATIVNPGNDTKKVTASGVAGDAGIFKSLTGGGKEKAAGGGDVAAGITGGGPRVINITIGKMVEKIEMHVQNASEGLHNIEEQVETIFLRVLNSGATVQ